METVLDQPFDGSSLATLRGAVTAYCGRCGLSGAQLDSIVLVAHELASNVVRHAGGRGRLRLWHTDSSVYCQVSDAGPGMRHPEEIGVDRPSPYQTGGRGVWLTRQLSTSVSIRSSETGTTVTTEMRVRPD